MFARTAAFITLALPIIAGASALPRTTEPGPTCSTGPIKCCNVSGNAKSPTVIGDLLGLGGLLNVVLGLTGNVAADCTTVNIIGIGGNSCNAQAVCCKDTVQNGLINVGCTPINLGL